MSFAWSEVDETEDDVSEMVDWNTMDVLRLPASGTVDTFYRMLRDELGGFKNSVDQKLDALVHSNNVEKEKIDRKIRRLKSQDRQGLHGRRSFDSEMASAGSQTSRVSVQRRVQPIAFGRSNSDLSYGNLASTSTVTERRGNLSSRARDSAQFAWSMSETNSIIDDSPTVSAVCGRDGQSTHASYVTRDAFVRTPADHLYEIDEETNEDSSMSHRRTPTESSALLMVESTDSFPEDETSEVYQDGSVHEIITVSKYEKAEQETNLRKDHGVNQPDRKEISTAEVPLSPSDLPGEQKSSSTSLTKDSQTDYRGSPSCVSPLLSLSPSQTEKRISSSEKAERERTLVPSASDSTSAPITFDAPSIATPVWDRNAPEELLVLERYASRDDSSAQLRQLGLRSATHTSSKPESHRPTSNQVSTVNGRQVAHNGSAKQVPLVRARDLVTNQGNRIRRSLTIPKRQVVSLERAVGSPKLTVHTSAKTQHKVATARQTVEALRGAGSKDIRDEPDKQSIVEHLQLHRVAPLSRKNLDEAEVPVSQKKPVSMKSGQKQLHLSRSKSLSGRTQHREASLVNDQIVQVRNTRIKDPYGDYGIYTGHMSAGQPNGHGTMRYEDTRLYVGEWKNGRWHGAGRALFGNGDVYVGEYNMDQRHGFGRYEWADKRVYDGEFCRDQRHGSGTYSWPDGSSYVGDFVFGQRSGNGFYTFKDGSTYCGGWKDGKYEGNGECRWSDGRTYSGGWVQGHANGFGVETRADGTIRHEGRLILQGVSCFRSILTVIAH